MIFSSSSSNISNARKSVSSDIQSLRSGLKKGDVAEFFNQCQSVRISDVFIFDISSQSIDNSWRDSKQTFTEFFECLIYLLNLRRYVKHFDKALIILGETQGKSSPNFMIVRMTYPNLRPCCDFLRFLFIIINEFENFVS